jgi:hypothetical protein
MNARVMVWDRIEHPGVVRHYSRHHLWQALMANIGFIIFSKPREVCAPWQQFKNESTDADPVDAYRIIPECAHRDYGRNIPLRTTLTDSRHARRAANREIVGHRQTWLFN